jgi:hypothetical protein
MSFFDGEFDITKKIKMIEKLKSSLLSQIAYLYSSMSEDEQPKEESYLDILADIMILTYLLSNKLGSANEALDIKVLNKLKLAMLGSQGESTEWVKELSELSKHLMKTRDL